MEKKYLVTAEQMKKLDQTAIEKNHIPAMVLMERAAMETARYAMELLVDCKKTRVLVVAGSGNNGADAVAAGRILCEYGCHADVFLTGEKKSPLLVQQLEVLSSYPAEVYESFPQNDYDLVLDGIFGIGLNRKITESDRAVIEKINALDTTVISLDIPSGIDATTGNVLGAAIEADVTVTYGFLKRGLFLGEGKWYAGKVIPVKMGIDETAISGTNPEMFTYYGKEEERIDLKRKKSGNKGDFGKVAIAAGNEKSAGAAILCAKSAFRSGCGMVELLTEKENQAAVLQAMPEVIFCGYTENFSKEDAASALGWADVIAAGPAMGTGKTAVSLMEQIIKAKKPLVIDADAITILALNPALDALLQKQQQNDKTRRAVLFTPHLKELAVLSAHTIETVKENTLAIARRVAEKYHAVVVAKDAATLVCCEDGTCYCNSSGSDAMATAGSGDVLTGLCASIAAQYEKKDEIPYEEVYDKERAFFYAACMAVYLHGCAGTHGESERGSSFLTAGDIIENYQYVMK